jgi:hypothetical protein
MRFLWRSDKKIAKTCIISSKYTPKIHTYRILLSAPAKNHTVRKSIAYVMIEELNVESFVLVLNAQIPKSTNTSKTILSNNKDG